MNQNGELAGATLAHLAGLGVKHVVVCAGARNAPLVTSLLATEEKAGWRIWHHFDERSAAFFALGMAKKSQEPVAVVTTSGTAVAELLPAVIEAYYSGIPLVLVTADRPTSYRGSGAPQAIDQVGIFAIYAPVSLDITGVLDLSAVVKWERNEPLHLNVRFEELTPEDTIDEFEPVELPRVAMSPGDDHVLTIEAFTANPEGLVVLLGELEASWRAPVEEFLIALGVPVWAEATSGLRESEALAHLLMRAEREVKESSPREILRIGGVPSLRYWRDLEEREGIEVLSVTRRLFSGLARLSRRLVIDEFPRWSEGFSPSRSLGEHAPAKGLKASLQPLLEKFPRSEPAMMRAISAMIPGDALVYLGNSLPIREWNLAAALDPSHARCYASRGANGIDGQIATFLGLSETEEESWGIFGDLTALYDLNAPALLSQLPNARRRIVIINNGGGKIFSRLPSLAGLSASGKQVTENHHAQGFEHWAAMWGMGYVKWEAGEESPRIEGDAVVIEVRVDEADTESFWSDWK